MDLRRGTLALAAAGLAVLSGCGHRSDERIAERFPAPGERISVGTHRLHLHCVGDGQAPPVVLESGMSGWSQDWARVQPLLARGGRVCAYDRAGYAWSDTPDPLPTGQQAVHDLRRLLDAAGVPSPRLLVGHSLGGLLIDMYARSYPQDVAGLVLIDAVGRNYAAQFPPGRYTAFRANLGRMLALADTVAPWGIPQMLGQSASLVAARLPPPERESATAWSLSARHFHTLRAENAAFDDTLTQALALGPLPRVPTVVLNSAHMRDFPPGLEDDAMRAAWVRNQEAIAHEAGATRQVSADSGHYVHLDDPGAVVRAIDGLRSTIANAPHPVR